MSETMAKSRSDRKVLEGQTLNGWEVLAYEGNHNHKSYYWCRCRCCGQVYLRRADKLLSGRTRRCGECAADGIKFEGEENQKVRQPRIPKKLRQAAYDKCGGRCAYCGEPIQYAEMEVDYLNPLQQGGKVQIDNLLPSCRICKRSRKNRQLDQFRRQLQAIPKTLERDCNYRLGKKYGIVHENPEPMIRFFFETGKRPDEKRMIQARDTIATYCKQNDCEDCPMEVNCCHGIEPQDWQIAGAHHEEETNKI